MGANDNIKKVRRAISRLDRSIHTYTHVVIHVQTLSMSNKVGDAF